MILPWPLLSVLVLIWGRASASLHLGGQGSTLQGEHNQNAAAVLLAATQGAGRSSATDSSGSPWAEIVWKIVEADNRGWSLVKVANTFEHSGTVQVPMNMAAPTSSISIAVQGLDKAGRSYIEVHSLPVGDVDSSVTTMHLDGYLVYRRSSHPPDAGPYVYLTVHCDGSGTPFQITVTPSTEAPAASPGDDSSGSFFEGMPDTSSKKDQERGPREETDRVAEACPGDGTVLVRLHAIHGEGGTSGGVNGASRSNASAQGYFECVPPPATESDMSVDVQVGFSWNWEASQLPAALLESGFVAELAAFGIQGTAGVERKTGNVGNANIEGSSLPPGLYSFTVDAPQCVRASLAFDVVDEGSLETAGYTSRRKLQDTLRKKLTNHIRKARGEVARRKKSDKAKADTADAIARLLVTKSAAGFRLRPVLLA
eukprot:gene10677-12367_t